MQYEKAKLRATAVSVRDEWLKIIAREQVREREKYLQHLDRWLNEDKNKAIETLENLFGRVKADLPIDMYELRSGNLRLSAPTPPKDADCCSPTTKLLDALVELLDTIQDETVSSRALSDAGYRDLSRLLRRPC